MALASWHCHRGFLLTAVFPVGKVLARLNQKSGVWEQAYPRRPGTVWKTMAELAGNLLVAQSGGPTAVINASVAGVIQEAGRHRDHIQEIYGGLKGIIGIVYEGLVDLQDDELET